MTSNRYSDARRLFQLLRELKGEGASLRDLQEKLQVSPATLRRDVHLLKEVGFDVRAVWRGAAKHLSCNATRLPMSQSLAAWMLVETTLFEEIQGGVIAQDLLLWRAEALERLRLPEPELSRRFYRRPGPHEAVLTRGEVLEDVLAGLLQGRVLQVRYRDFSGKEQELHIEPWTLARIGERLYCVGRRYQQGQPVPWRIDRFLSVARTKLHFALPADYEPAQVFTGRMGAFAGDGLTLRRVLLRIDHHWHGSVQRARLPIPHRALPADGAMHPIELDVALDRPFFQWVLRMSAGAEVVAPPEARAIWEAHIDALHTRRALHVGPEGKVTTLHLQGEVAQIVQRLDWPASVVITPTPDGCTWMGPLLPSPALERWLRGWDIYPAGTTNGPTH